MQKLFSTLFNFYKQKLHFVTCWCRIRGLCLDSVAVYRRHRGRSTDLNGKNCRGSYRSWIFFEKWFDWRKLIRSFEITYRGWYAFLIGDSSRGTVAVRGGSELMKAWRYRRSLQMRRRRSWRLQIGGCCRCAVAVSRWLVWTEILQ